MKSIFALLIKTNAWFLNLKWCNYCFRSKRVQIYPCG